MTTPDNATGGWSDEQRDHAVLRARQAISRGINDIVEGTHGDSAFVDEPAFPGARTMMRRPDAAAAIRAAVVLRDRAAAELATQILKARGKGTTWDLIAGILGYTDRDDAMGFPDERAFYLVASEERGSLRPSTTTWRCVTCGKLVTDRGPFDANPANNESGHYQGCTRLAVEVAHYRRAWGDA